jgi:hypothetical protein
VGEANAYDRIVPITTKMVRTSDRAPAPNIHADGNRWVDLDDLSGQPIAVNVHEPSTITNDEVVWRTRTMMTSGPARRPRMTPTKSSQYP